MLGSLLVPLDGSTMAEQATIAAGEIARRHKARLLLASVHPWGPDEDRPRPNTTADRELRQTEMAYLEALRARLSRAFGIDVVAHLLDGSVAPALADLARVEHVDLIVSSTHGHGRLWHALRSVGIIELVHRVTCPTLFIKPLQASPSVIPPQGFRRVLVALDGSSDPAAMARSVLELSALGELLVSLVRVVSPQVWGNRSLVERQREALKYVCRVSRSLRRPGLQVRSRVLTSPDPPAAILEEAGRSKSELVVLAPRHRDRMGIVLLPSLTNAIVQRECPPVLVCHARTAPQRLPVLNPLHPLNDAFAARGTTI
ncbi:MAG TPA: universal stress protein [Gemmatimonadales bacterium]|nr:universal stress protein [Gemmatimonadales bacterium]